MSALISTKELAEMKTKCIKDNYKVNKHNGVHYFFTIFVVELFILARSMLSQFSLKHPTLLHYN